MKIVADNLLVSCNPIKDIVHLQNGQVKKDETLFLLKAR
jgi:hypothetical protein